MTSVDGTAARETRQTDTVFSASPGQPATPARAVHPNGEVRHCATSAPRSTSSDAYRAGLCVDCRTERYSAGRPRCDSCHYAYQLDPTRKDTER